MKASQLGVQRRRRRRGDAAAPRRHRPTPRPCSRSATRSASTPGRRRASSRPSARLRRRRPGRQGAGRRSRSSATSLTNVVALGARFGDTLLVSASGRRPTTSLWRWRARRRGVRRRRRRRPRSRPPRPRPQHRSRPAAGGPARQADWGSEVTPRPPVTSSAVSPPRPGSRSAPSTISCPDRPAAGRAAEDPQRERERFNKASPPRAQRSCATATWSRPAPARLRPRSSTPTSRSSTTRRCSIRRTPAIAAGATAERAWYDAAEQVAELYRGLDEPLLAERAADVSTSAAGFVARSPASRAADPVGRRS